MTDVAVITATYNSADVIERNIRSVGSQSLKPAEHIVVDDGSADDTVDIVCELQREFPHLKLVRQKNGGAGAARNTAIEMAGSRYVAFLDSDDYWSERKLETQIGFMMTHGVAFSYGDYDTVDATGKPLGRLQPPERVAYADFLRGCPIGCLTAAFDQSILGKRYMPGVRRGQDWGLWLALTRDGTVARRYPGCHAIYHRSNGSLSSDKVRKAGDIYRIYREQERIGPTRSLYYMVPHIYNALSKRPRLQERTPTAAVSSRQMPAGRKEEAPLAPSSSRP
jgi:glycosyltransferase involved in cell wall biosynthesis